MVLKIPPLKDGACMLRERQIDLVPYAANSNQRVRIRVRPNLIRHILLHVKCTLSAGSALTITPGFPWRLIRRINITTPRGEILKSVSGLMLHYLNLLEYGTEELNTFPVNLEIGLTDVEFDMCIPFYSHMNIASTFTNRSTSLNTNEFTEVFFNIEWADLIQDAFSSPLITITDFECQLIVLEREPVNTSDQVEPRMKMIDYDTYYTPDSDQLEILLPENSSIKTVFFQCFDSDYAKYPPETTIVTLASITANDLARSLREWSGQEIKSQNQYYYHVEPGQMGSSYAIEFDQMKDGTSRFSTVGINWPKLVIDFDPDNIPDIVGVFIRQIIASPALTMM